MIFSAYNSTSTQRVEFLDDCLLQDAYYLWTAREITKWIQSAVDFPIELKFFPGSTGELKKGIELHVAPLNDKCKIFFHVPNGQIRCIVSKKEKDKILELAENYLAAKKTNYSCVNCNWPCTTKQIITKWKDREISTCFIENDIQFKDENSTNRLFKDMKNFEQSFSRVFSSGKPIVHQLRDRELGIRGV